MMFDATDVIKLVLWVILGAFIGCLLLVRFSADTPAARRKGVVGVIAVFVVGLGWGYYSLIFKPVRMAAEEAKRKGEPSQQEREERYAKGKALFDARCKSAEEKVYRTVEGVDGVLLMNVRGADMTEKNSDPYWPDAGLAQQYGGEDYIESFIQWEHGRTPLERGTLNRRPTNVNNYPVSPGYSYVDVKEDSSLYRYKLTSAPDPKVNKERLNKAPARYAVSFENIINPTDRKYWVAGTTVIITDTKTQEVIAKKTWYSFEPGFGSHAGNRQPWRFAVTCPTNKGWAERAPTRFFVDQILKPKQRN